MKHGVEVPALYLRFRSLGNLSLARLQSEKLMCDYGNQRCQIVHTLASFTINCKIKRERERERLCV
jgi:hypothetical protein